jgi:bifunctional DNA-binding transcriptional regulator/antitoxin component of YhaV-PrlF toxin-antitoxin module
VAKVTSKLQVTVPKAIADEYRIKPGDDIVWLPSGDSIRVQTRAARPAGRSMASRLHLFDEATKRQTKRQAKRQARKQASLSSTAASSRSDRHWRREDLYDRGRSR